MIEAEVHLTKIIYRQIKKKPSFMDKKVLRAFYLSSMCLTQYLLKCNLAPASSMAVISSSVSSKLVSRV